MSKPVIAIDIDEVIADTTEAVRLITNKRTGIDLPPEAYAIHADYWGYYESVWKHHDVYDITFKEIHEELTTDHLAVKILPAAEFALGRLMKKYDVVFVTARNDDRRADTHEWFNAWLPELKPNVYFSNYLDEARRVSKGELCKELGAELLIDDNFDHCLSAVESGLKAILFGNYGWQYKAEAHDSIVVCKNWQAVLEHLNVD